MGFPGVASGKEPTCQCRILKRCGFELWVGKIPWRRAWQPTAVFLPGESHGQTSLVGYSPKGRTESDTSKVCVYTHTYKHTHTHTHTHTEILLRSALNVQINLEILWTFFWWQVFPPWNVTFLHLYKASLQIFIMFLINFKIISKGGNYKTNIGIKKNKIFCQCGQEI